MIALVIIGIVMIFIFLQYKGKKVLTEQKGVKPQKYVANKKPGTPYGVKSAWYDLSPEDAERERIFIMAVTGYLFDLQTKVIDDLIDWEFVDNTIRPHCNNFSNKIKLYYDCGDSVMVVDGIINTEKVYRFYFPDKFKTEKKEEKQEIDVVAEWMSKKYLQQYLPALKKDGFINIPLEEVLWDSVCEIKRRIQMDSRINYEYDNNSHEIKLVYS